MTDGERESFTTGMRPLVCFRLAYDNVSLSSDATKYSTVSLSTFNVHAWKRLAVRFYNATESLAKNNHCVKAVVRLFRPR